MASCCSWEAKPEPHGSTPLVAVVAKLTLVSGWRGEVHGDDGWLGSGVVGPRRDVNSERKNEM